MTRPHKREYLGELYVTQRLDKIQEQRQRLLKEERIDRIKRIQKMVIREANQRIILEKLDANELRKLSQSIKKIAGIVTGYDLPTIKGGIQQAAQETAKIMSGGTDGVISRIKQMFRGGNVKPLAKVMAFEKTMTTTLSQLSVILDIITANDPGIGKNSPNAKITDVLEPEEIQGVEDMIIKSLKGPLKLFGSNNVPYIDDPLAIANELLSLSIKNFSDLSKKAGGIETVTDDETAQQVGDEALEDHETEGKAEEQESSQPKEASAIDAAHKELKGQGIAIPLPSFEKVVKALKNNGMKF